MSSQPEQPTPGPRTEGDIEADLARANRAAGLGTAGAAETAAVLQAELDSWGATAVAVDAGSSESGQASSVDVERGGTAPASVPPPPGNPAKKPVKKSGSVFKRP